MTRTFAALLLVMAMTGNLFAAVSCAEVCAAAPAGHSGHPAEDQAATLHAGHVKEMSSHLHPAPTPAASVEGLACSAHQQPAVAKATVPAASRNSVIILEANRDTASTSAASFGEQFTASPPPSPHLSSFLTLRI